jgi:hypothetical protein
MEESLPTTSVQDKAWLHQKVVRLQENGNQHCMGVRTADTPPKKMPEQP